MPYDSRYGTSRFLLKICEVVAWIIVGFGLFFAVIGFGTGGMLGAMFGPSAARGIGGGGMLLIRIVAAIPGLSASIGGLFALVLVHHFRAGIDSAEMTREMLMIMRRG